MPSTRQLVTRATELVSSVQEWAQQRLVWRVWERMLETEFVDRSVALAGKAFVSFFPLVIVVAAFMPTSIRTSILTTLTSRLGVRGHALDLAREAFASSDDIRRATGFLGLILTFFYATSFTTALQRVYLRAWRRPLGTKAGAYTRGPAWLVALLVYMAVTGGLRGVLGDGPGLALFVVAALTVSMAWWWFTASFLLLGQVRWRVLIPTGVITGVAISGYAVSAIVWMPNVVTQNQTQFGFIGVALALVTWFSGAAICVFIGACAGPVLAEDPGPLGRFIRGSNPDLLVEGAPASRPAPTRELRVRDAFRSTDEADETTTGSDDDT
jgi:membrane protein